MRNKYFKLIITFAVVLCTFCASVTVFATGDETTESTTTTENTTAPQTPSTEESTENENPGGLVDDTEAESTTKSTTKATTAVVIVTEDDNTVSTTKKKPTTTASTTRGNSSSSSNTTTTRRSNTTTTDEDESTETTDETLPEGHFYVHLVLGNGENNKKIVMEKPGLVKAYPDPKWEGHIFEGWYSDAKFTKPWDFAKDKATEEMTIYAKWSVDAATFVYTITVSPVDGGKITVSPASATEGTPVIITVKPDSGKRLVAGSLTINGKATDVLSFNMPAQDVVLSAKFENVPVAVEEEEKDNSIIFILVGAGVVVVGLVIAGIVMLKRKNEIVVPEFDENGAVIIEDDDEVWVDESLVIEDAFPGVKSASGEKQTEGDDEDMIIAPAETPVEKTKGLTDIVNNEEWDEISIDNDAKLTEAVEEEKKEASDISKIDFSLFE